MAQVALRPWIRAKALETHELHRARPRLDERWCRGKIAYRAARQLDIDIRGRVRGSGDQVPGTAARAEEGEDVQRIATATEGRQAETRSSRVALLDPAAKSRSATHPRLLAIGLTTSRREQTGGRLNTDVADADGVPPGLADVEAGVPAYRPACAVRSRCLARQLECRPGFMPRRSTGRVNWLGNSPVLVPGRSKDPGRNDTRWGVRFCLEPDKSPQLPGWRRACRDR